MQTLALLASALLAAANPNPSPLPAVVATIAGEPVAASELEASAAVELAQLDGQRQQVLEAALDRLLSERLLAREAARRSLTVEALLAAEVAAKLEPITDDAVAAWYAANRERVPQPLATVAGPIRNYLETEGRQRLTNQLLSELRQRYPVTNLLPVLRRDVASAAAPARGPANASVTIVEFSDFQCPYCRQLQPAIDQALAKYGDRVRLEFRHFPLTSIHPNAEPAARAAICAAEQGRFWPVHDQLFAHQEALGGEAIGLLARDAELDAAAVERCRDAATTSARLAADVEAGRRAGVGSTPSLFVNGRPLVIYAARPAFEQIAEAIDAELTRATAGRS
jgi:protein-disulfide isomerase